MCNLKGYTRLIGLHIFHQRRKLPYLVDDDYRGEMHQSALDQIDNYERKCIQNAENLTEFEEFAIDSQKKAKDWKNFINQPLIKEGEIKTITSDLLKMKKELDFCRKRFKKVIFDNKRLQFFEIRLL